MQSQSKYKISDLARLAIFVAVAIAINWFERMLPMNFMAPGVKLGLANIVTLVLLYIYSFKEAMIVLIARIMLSSLMFAGLSSFLYSFVGGVLSLLGMYLAIKLIKSDITEIGISLIGAFCHNTGQILVMMFMLKSVREALYWYPILVFVGIGSGFAIGIIANSFIAHYKTVSRSFLR